MRDAGSVARRGQEQKANSLPASLRAAMPTWCARRKARLLQEKVSDEDRNCPAWRANALRLAADIYRSGLPGDIVYRFMRFKRLGRGCRGLSPKMASFGYAQDGFSSCRWSSRRENCEFR